jgi:hypothetical protein
MYICIKLLSFGIGVGAGVGATPQVSGPAQHRTASPSYEVHDVVFEVQHCVVSWPAHLLEEVAEGLHTHVSLLNI